jgi:hypothetical protein
LGHINATVEKTATTLGPAMNADLDSVGLARKNTTTDNSFAPPAFCVC